MDIAGPERVVVTYDYGDIRHLIGAGFVITTDEKNVARLEENGWSILFEPSMIKASNVWVVYSPLDR